MYREKKWTYFSWKRRSLVFLTLPRSWIMWKMRDDKDLAEIEGCISSSTSSKFVIAAHSVESSRDNESFVIPLAHRAGVCSLKLLREKKLPPDGAEFTRDIIWAFLKICISFAGLA